jgi:hypothetical protein
VPRTVEIHGSCTMRAVPYHIPLRPLPSWQELEGREELRVQLWKEENAEALRTDMQQLEGLVLKVRLLCWVQHCLLLSPHVHTGRLSGCFHSLAEGCTHRVRHKNHDCSK